MKRKAIRFISAVKEVFLFLFFLQPATQGWTLGG